MNRRVKRLLKKFLANERAVSAVEYAIWGGLVSIIIVTSVTSIGKSASTMFNSVATSI